ncbi:uncharacterized protein LOC108670982 [Hyalella azteca]|uniref:Uncharacterized protein LOC108670982 n=1 Tax=Hyalella azteca TaxID=294128 RepID=A0A8B7NJY2_HYAAZ|nr:uncharacterized protein LOC108670982 [Hyalella azteca]
MKKWFGAEVCVKEGSNVTASSADRCVCNPGWGGRRCGLPQSVLSHSWMTEPKLVASLQVRKRPRRVIVFINNYYYDAGILELNIRMLGDLVDVYVVSEEEVLYRHKNESFVFMLENGFLKDFHDKLVFVNITEPSLPSIDKLHFTVVEGLKLISDLRVDDLFIFLTPEHILSRDFVLFLKLFHNYPQPVRCGFNQHVYGLQLVLPSGSENINLSSEASEIKVASSNRHQFGSVHISLEGASHVPNSSKRHRRDAFNNALFNELYSNHTQFEQNISDVPSICAVSALVLSNVFENKMQRLQEESLLLKKNHLEFFDSLNYPLFPWTYENAGWRCHLCLMSSSDIYEKLRVMPDYLAPSWFDGQPSVQSRMILIIEKLRSNEMTEYQIQAQRISIHGSQSRIIPKYVLEHEAQYYQKLFFL